LKVEGVENLFCAGEKAGPLVGHTEAVCTGTVAGDNAVRHVRGETPLRLPEGTAVGDAIRFVRRQMATEEGLALKYTFSGSVYFQRMQELGLYETDPVRISDRVASLGLERVFAH
jgi:folate-dependent tRNA-U54 methylase TrmFO/GidA